MAWAIAISMGLQRGVPLEDYVRMFAHMSFEPAGFTDNPQIPFASSIPDYVVRYLASRYLDPEAQEALGIHQVRMNGTTENGIQVAMVEPGPKNGGESGKRLLSEARQADSPTCMNCGNLMQRNGACYVCTNCGSTSGCS